MYLERYGLTRRPFPPTPDSSLYYPATPHEQALDPLLRAIRDDEGIALLVGEPGTGKTLLGQVFLERLGDEAVSAFLPHGQFPDRAAFLQTVLFDLGLPYTDTEHVLRLRLTEHALKTCAEGKRLVVVVDEAHHLSAELLEELRLLGNLEAGRKAFQVLGLAQPGILQTLKQPALAALNQRIAARLCLPALAAEDAHDYLLHHLRVAGGRPETLFEDAALQAIVQVSRGVPRLLNQAAHMSLQLAAAGELGSVDVECALEALARLGLEAAEGADGAEGDAGPERILDLKAVDPTRRTDPIRRSA